MTPRYEAPSRSTSGTDADLLDQLRYADGRPYGFYKNALGAWDYGDFTLAIDHVQADPYAPPSSLRAWSTPEAMGLPEAALASSDARLAAADFIARSFDEAIRARGARDVSIARAGALILQRSYATVLPDRVEVRFQVKLPARGRTILGKSAARLFDVDVPNIVMDCFDFVSEDPDTTRKRSRLLGHVAAYEDYRALQGILEERGWVSFVADEALLARRSGVSEAPLTGDGVVAFSAPETLRATVTLPHAGEVSGMAIPPGLTLIVGGGYHGKSTLLEAIAQGVYAHVPGDGRELVATDPTATKVRAADGRAVTGEGGLGHAGAAREHGLVGDEGHPPALLEDPLEGAVVLVGGDVAEEAGAFAGRRRVLGDEVEAVHDDVGHVHVEEAGGALAQDRAASRGELDLEAHLDTVGHDGGVGALEDQGAGAGDRHVACAAGADSLVEGAGNEVGGGQAGVGRGQGGLGQSHGLGAGPGSQG